MKTIPNEEAAKEPRRSRSHSAAEQLQYINQWETSGLTAEAFARLHPIKPESLYRWRMKEKSRKMKESRFSQQTFKELKIAKPPRSRFPSDPTITLKSPAFEIALAGVELDARLSDFLKTLSKEVFGV